jgi:membrane protein DedA with SNARE-associated domain
MERHLFDELVRYGPPALFLAQVLGLFGVPIPDEILLTIAGALVRQGTLDGPSTLVAAISGCMAGITLSYVLGRTICARVLCRIPGVRSDKIEHLREWFKRSGKWLLTFGYFVPGVRHVTAIAAGSAPLDFPAFATYAYPGAVLWSTTFLAAGYYAGDRAQQVAVVLREHLMVLGLALALLLMLYVIVQRRART